MENKLWRIIMKKIIARVLFGICYVALSAIGLLLKGVCLAVVIYVAYLVIKWLMGW